MTLTQVQQLSTAAHDDAEKATQPMGQAGAAAHAVADKVAASQQIDPVSGRTYADAYGYRPKVTWHLRPAWQRNLWEFIVSMDLGPDVVYMTRDTKAPMRGPPPHQSMLREHLFILSKAVAPMGIHAGWNWLFPNHLITWAPAWMLYHLGMIYFALTHIARLHRYMAAYGTFDEANRGRDIIDDSHVNHVGRSIFIYTIFRTMAPFLIAWRGPMVNPFDGLSFLTPIKIGMWQICLDYFFYLYHRSTHQWDSLWWIHRQHHATKHPTPILSILADDVQEVLEIFIIPILATTFGPKMSFAELELTAIYMLYIESLGHSGVRADWGNPMLDFILRPLKMNLVVEDHDLHHRFGKSGRNYGKQTRIFDRIFGTVGERIEGDL